MFIIVICRPTVVLHDKIDYPFAFNINAAILDLRCISAANNIMQNQAKPLFVKNTEHLLYCPNGVSVVFTDQLVI